MCALRAAKSRGELEDLLAETACSEPHCARLERHLMEVYIYEGEE